MARTAASSDSPSGWRRSFHGAALGIFGRFPRKWRRRIVRALSPSWTVGAVCLIEREDRRILMIRHSYRDKWGLPGGILRKGETPEDGAIREVREEVGVVVELLGGPVVVVAPAHQRVDMVFRARPASAGAADSVGPVSAEIREVRWFEPGSLPELQEEAVNALEMLGVAQ